MLSSSVGSISHVTLVLVSYNEVEAMPIVCAEIAEAIVELGGLGIAVDVILVDDNSPDGTAQVAEREAGLWSFDLTIDTGVRSGVGAAFLRGILRAETNTACDLIVTLDADGQHDARVIPELIRAFVETSADLVIGSRWTPGGVAVGLSRYRTLASKAANRFFAASTGCTCRDATTSFRAFRPGLVDLQELKSLGLDGYTFFSSFVALAHFDGATISETPIKFRPRIAGESKLTPAEGLRFSLNAARLRSYAPMWTSASTLRAVTDPNEADDIPPEIVEGKALAVNFNTWMVDLSDVKPGERVLEVGAGVGALTPLLASRCAEVLALEPNEMLFPELSATCIDVENASCQQGTIEALPADGRFDRILYVNVLEHIAFEVDELKAAGSLLGFDGRLVVLGPASPPLYSELDLRSGHYRRHTTATLTATLHNAGFEVEEIGYFDHASYVPYLLIYRLLHRTVVDESAVKLFDSVLVPLSRRLAAGMKAVPGKNVFAVARLGGR
ncbi:MAG: glycosyltransferase [Acidimicrobiaceae bacterium]|nr:glycosyltransferase [Acidimicrobiaceae bacterium]